MRILNKIVVLEQKKLNLKGDNMKMIVYIILLSSLATSSAIAAEWEPIGETGRYFDKSNLTIMDKNIVSTTVAAGNHSHVIAIGVDIKSLLFAETFSKVPKSLDMPGVL